MFSPKVRKFAQLLYDEFDDEIGFDYLRQISEEAIEEDDEDEVMQAAQSLERVMARMSEDE